MRNIIGLRTLKTGITVAIAVILANYFAKDQSFVIIFTSVVALENTVLSSYTTGIKRAINTVIGAIIALGLVYTGLPNFITIPIAVVLLIIVSNKILGDNTSIGISASVLILILINTSQNPLLYSIVRIRDTFIGVSIALLINILVAPPKLKIRLRNTAIELADETRLLINYVLYYNQVGKLDDYRAKVTLLTKELQQIREEIGFRKSISDPEIDNYRQLIISYQRVCVYIENLSLLNFNTRLTVNNSMEIKKLFNHELVNEVVDDSKVELKKEEILFNYLIEKLLDNEKKIKIYEEKLGLI